MKKVLSLVMALLMLCLPLGALADTPAEMLLEVISNGRALTEKTAFQVEADEGADPRYAAYADLLNVLASSVTISQTQLAADVTLNDNNVFDVIIEGNESGLYVKSSWLGDGVLLFTPEDLVNALKASNVDVEQIIASMNGASNISIDVNEETFANTMAWVQNVLAANMTMGPAEEDENQHDPAVSQLQVSLTGEQLLELVEAMHTDMAGVVEQLNGIEIPGMQGNQMSFADLEAQMYSGAKQLFSNVQTLDVTALMDEANSIVYATTVVTFPVSVDAETAVTADVAVYYARLTDPDDGSVEHSVVANISANEQIAMALTAVVTTNFGDEETSLTTHFDVAQNNGTETAQLMNYESTIVVAKENGDVSGMSADQIDLPGVSAASATVISSGDPLESIVTEDAVRPLAMDEEARNAWLSGISQNLQEHFVTLLQQLPESLQTMVMSSMQQAVPAE